PGPASPVDFDRDPGARRLAEPPREGVRAELRVEDHAVAVEHAARDRAEEAVVADAADRDRVHPGDAGGAQRLDLVPELLPVDLARGGDAVGDPEDPRRLRLLRLVDRPADRLLEVGRAERAAGHDRGDLFVAEVARVAFEDRDDVLVEAR